jgi:hypothetical protein
VVYHSVGGHFICMNISRRDIMPTPLRVGGILCLLGRHNE